MSPRVPSARLARLAGLETATIHEAQGRRGALPSSIKPVHGHFRVCGPAFTVQSAPGDNLWIHRGVNAAQPGDVLVINVGGETESGYWGEILSVAAMTRGLGGVVMTGAVRDVVQLGSVGFPVFAGGICIRGTSKDPDASGSLGAAVWIGDVEVEPGDVVVGDLDGVVIVKASEVSAVADVAMARAKKEEAIMERIRAGETTLEIFGL